jgi:hypothetical protein
MLSAPGGLACWMSVASHCETFSRRAAAFKRTGAGPRSLAGCVMKTFVIYVASVSIGMTIVAVRPQQAAEEGANLLATRPFSGAKHSRDEAAFAVEQSTGNRIRCPGKINSPVLARGYQFPAGDCRAVNRVERSYRRGWPP